MGGREGGREGRREGEREGRIDGKRKRRREKRREGERESERAQGRPWKDITRMRVLTRTPMPEPQPPDCEINVCHLSHPVCGIVFQQPELTKTPQKCRPPEPQEDRGPPLTTEVGVHGFA